MAEEQLFGFTIAQVERLRRMLSIVEGDDYEPLSRGRTKIKQPARSIVGLLTDPVAATTGLATTPKVGTLNVYSFTSTGSEDTGVDEKVYNFAPQAATTDRWTFASRDSFTGKWKIDFQACS